MEEFLPRFNQRFKAPAQYPETAFRPLDPELCLERVLCFKHSRKVAKDNTVRFQLHTLQLLPGPDRPSYAGTVVEVLVALDAGSRSGVTGAQSLPRRRLLRRFFSEMGAGHSTTCQYLISVPAPRQKAGARLLRHWTQWQMTPKKAALP